MTADTLQPRITDAANGSVSKPNVLEPWLNQKYTCVHCGKVLEKGLPALRGHLGHCRMRLLNRFFVVGKFLFAVKCNPLKRKILSADEEIKETHDARVFLGLLKGFQRYGLINSFSVTELENWTKETPLFPDGMVTFGALKKKLSPTNMQLFKTDVEKLQNPQIDIPVEQTGNDR